MNKADLLIADEGFRLRMLTDKTRIQSMSKCDLSPLSPEQEIGGTHLQFEAFGLRRGELRAA